MIRYPVSDYLAVVVDDSQCVVLERRLLDGTDDVVNTTVSDVNRLVAALRYAQAEAGR